MRFNIVKNVSNYFLRNPPLEVDCVRENRSKDLRKSFNGSEKKFLKVWEKFGQACGRVWILDKWENKGNMKRKDFCLIETAHKIETP